MNYFYIGHCQEGTSDKVWGLIRLTGTEDHLQYGYRTNDFIAFWGRRGKKLQTKIHHSIDSYDAQKLCDKKESGGYKEVNPAYLGEVYPEFEQDLEKTAVWAMLGV
jgi:predicted DNA-binding WGR domain protein